MTARVQVQSNLPVPPGEYLHEVLDEMGMSQAELSRRIGRPIQMINEIIKGEKAITPETAIQLAQVLVVPAHVWTGLEMEYELTKAKIQYEQDLAKEESAAQRFPFRELIKDGWVKSVRKMSAKVEELRRFYGVSSLTRLEYVDRLEPAFRKSSAFQSIPGALAAWIRAGELRARTRQTPAFDKNKLQSALSDIRRLSRSEPSVFVPRIQDILSSCGVAFVFQRHFKETYVQGATFWLTSDKVAVLLSNRGKCADIFFFSLFHELGHVLLHGKRDVFVREVDGDSNPLEKEADAFARDQLISRNALARFREQCSDKYFSAEAIEDFAVGIGVSADIIIGRLQREDLVGPEHLARLRKKISDELLEKGGDENGQLQPQ